MTDGVRRHTHEGQHGPACATGASQQAKACSAVAGADLTGLVVEDAGQYGDAAWTQCAAHGGRKFDQRARQQIGEHQIEGPRRP